MCLAHIFTCMLSHTPLAEFCTKGQCTEFFTPGFWGTVSSRWTLVQARPDPLCRAQGLVFSFVPKTECGGCLRVPGFSHSIKPKLNDFSLRADTTPPRLFSKIAQIGTRGSGVDCDCSQDANSCCQQKMPQPHWNGEGDLNISFFIFLQLIIK